MDGDGDGVPSEKHGRQETDDAEGWRLEEIRRIHASVVAIRVPPSVGNMAIMRQNTQEYSADPRSYI